MRIGADFNVINVRDTLLLTVVSLEIVRLRR